MKQQPDTSAASGAPAAKDDGSVGRKAKILTLLDRARVNCSLQPETPRRLQQTPASASLSTASTAEHASPAAVPLRRCDSSSSTDSEAPFPLDIKPRFALDQPSERLDHCDGHDNPDTNGSERPASAAPYNAPPHGKPTSNVDVVSASSQANPSANDGLQSVHGRVTPPPPTATVALAPSPANAPATAASTAHPTHSSNPTASMSPSSSSAWSLPSAGDAQRPPDDKDAVMRAVSNDLQQLAPPTRPARPTRPSSRPTSHIAVLNNTSGPATLSRPHTVSLASIKQPSGSTPLLTQLRPLQASRHQEVPHELPPRSQPKRQTLKSEHGAKPQRQERPDLASSHAAAFRDLARLTPDEYEDAELHGDFPHVLQLLIPANATAALLEHRGQPVRDIGKQTACSLSIREPSASPFKDDRVLRVAGKAKGICLAQRLVVARIRAFRAERRDPNYMDLTAESPPVALPATSVTKALSAAVASSKLLRQPSEDALELTSPLHWLVEREDVGKMMGRQGVILAAIRRDSGATIRVDEDPIPGTTERRVTVSGPLEAVASALEDIRAKAGGRPEASASRATHKRLGQYFAIPFRSSGCLIGPQGAIVKSINDRSGARLQIPDTEDLPLGSVNRILHVQGTAQQSEHARRIVAAKLRAYLADAKHARPVTPASTGSKGDVVAVKVLLPTRICSVLLAQRGQLLREVSATSGAHTHFLAPHAPDARVCVFVGEMAAVLRAQRLVLQLVAGDAISSQRGAVPRKRKRPQRGEEEEEESDGRQNLDVYMDGEVHGHAQADELYHEDEDIARRQPVRRLPVLQQRLPRRHLDEGGRQDGYDYAYSQDDLDYDEYDPRPRLRAPVPVVRQPARCAPVPLAVATRRREFLDDGDGDGDEYEYEDEDEDEYEEDPEVLLEPRASRPLVREPVRRLAVPRGRRSAYDDADEYNYDVDDRYEDDMDVEYVQQPRRHPVVTRQAFASRRGGPQHPGRTVNVVGPRTRVSVENRRGGGSAGGLGRPVRGSSRRGRGGGGGGGSARGRPAQSNKRRRQ